MRRRRCTLLALPVVLVVTSACNGAGPTATATTLSGGVRVMTDVPFAANLAADLYLPAEPSAKPTIVWIHGGGFTAGSKTQMNGLAAELARRGYPGMAIDYRLSDGGPWFPAAALDDPALRAAAADAVEDAGKAVVWLRSADGRRRGVGGERVVVAGYSAGGITAASLAAEGDDAIDGALVGAIAIAGAAIDPSALSPSAPPLLLVHGTLDDVVPIALARATCASAERVASTCTVDAVPGAGHALPFDDPDRVTSSIEAFLAAIG